MFHWSIVTHAKARRKSVTCAVEGAYAPRTARQNAEEFLKEGKNELSQLDYHRT